MRDRLKRLQSAAARVALNPLIPADVRGLLADAAGLLGELVTRVEQLEKVNDESKNR